MRKAFGVSYFQSGLMATVHVARRLAASYKSLSLPYSMDCRAPADQTSLESDFDRAYRLLFADDRSVAARPAC